MESNELNKQNRNRLIDTENRLALLKGRGLEGLGEKCEGSKQTKNLADTDTNTVITRGKGGGGGRMVMEGSLIWGGKHTLQYRDDI